MIDQEKQNLGIWALYKQSLKKNDSNFNLYIARPLAAPFVYLFARTRVTPNQITFLSTLVMLLGVICLACVQGPLGIYLGLFGIEFSYVLDCVDGQLARVTQRTSEVGGDLDFMMDELKAYILIFGLGYRGSFIDQGQWYGLPDCLSTTPMLWPILVAIMALLITASAITLTRFIRSEKYALATGGKAQKHGQSAGEGRSGGLLWPVKMFARLITQYPASLPLFAFTSSLDLFLYAYAILHLLYAGQAILGIFLKLGKFAPSSLTPSSPPSTQQEEQP